MRALCIMHVPFEGPGYVKDWVEGKKTDLGILKLYEDTRLPEPADSDFLILMGGPMSIYDSERYAWLEAEKTFIRAAVEAGTRILGICLGAQLLADVLGKRVYPCPEKEIGWFPVRLAEEVRSLGTFKSMPPVFTAFHWHGETFDIPDGAVRIAGSDAAVNQGFLFGDRILALQFHLEINPEIAEGLIEHGRHELVPGKYLQGAEEIRQGLQAHRRIRELMFRLLDGWFGNQRNTAWNE